MTKQDRIFVRKCVYAGDVANVTSTIMVDDDNDHHHYDDNDY